MRALLFVFLSSVFFQAHSQSYKIDSLQRLINREGSTKRKVELLNQLSLFFFDSNVEQADGPSQQALEIASKIGDKQVEGWANAYRGIYFFLNGILGDAQIHFEKSLALGETIHDINLQTYSLTQLGNVFRDKGEYGSAYQYFKKAEVTSLKKPDNRYRSIVKLNLARYYFIINEPDSALEVATEALRIRQQMNDSILMADAWILIGNCYRGKDDFQVAEQYYQKAFPFINKDEIIKADYLQNMGEVYFARGDFQGALENWSATLTYQRKFQYKYSLAELLLRMGVVFQEQGYFDLATEFLSRGLKIAEKASYQYLVGEILHQQSWVYFRTRNFTMALDFNRKATKTFEKIKAKLEIAGCWDLRGLVERNLMHFDSSYYYHKISLNERTRIGNKVDISASLFNTGELYLETKEYSTALHYYFRSLKIDRTLGDNYGISLGYNRIGRIYTLLNVFDSAKFYLDKSIEIAIPISSNEVYRDNHIDMAKYYQAIGKPSQAIQYYEKYSQQTDSLFSTKTAQSLASYRTLYDVERNEQQIELLNKDNELSKAQNRQQKVILFASIAGSMILLLLAAFYYRFSNTQKRLNIALIEKNEEIQAQAEELQESNEVLGKLYNEIAERNEEVQAQSEELSKANEQFILVNKELANKQNELEAQSEELRESNEIISELNNSLELKVEDRTQQLKQAYKELDTFFYRSSHDFRRPLTTFMGLAEVAKITVKDANALDLFDKVKETAVNLDRMLIKLQSISDIGALQFVYKELSLKQVFESTLDTYRDGINERKIKTTIEVEPIANFSSYPAFLKIILDNLVENAIQFCGRTSPYIKLMAQERNGSVVITVEDNGVGVEDEYKDRLFDMFFRGNELSKGNGLGLYIVQKAIEKLNGTLVFESRVGKGSIFTISLPINQPGK